MDALSNEARNRMEVMDCFRLENRFVNEILALSSSVRPSFGNGRENSYQAKLCVTSEERCRRNLAVNRVNVHSSKECTNSAVHLLNLTTIKTLLWNLRRKCAGVLVGISCKFVPNSG